MICFVAALQRELEPVIAQYSKKSKRYGYATVHECELDGKSFLLMVSGMGKVFSGMSVAGLINSKDYPVDIIINIGVGGSLVPDKAGLLSCILGSSFIQHDMDSSPLGDPIGMISGICVTEFEANKDCLKKLEATCAKLSYPHYEGLICSGDQFIASQKEIDHIFHNYPRTISVDMETAAFAQGCYVHNVPFAAIRFISDTGHPGEYEKYFSACRERIAEFIPAFIKDNA